MAVNLWVIRRTAIRLVFMFCSVLTPHVELCALELWYTQVHIPLMTENSETIFGCSVVGVFCLPVAKIRQQLFMFICYVTSRFSKYWLS